MYNCVSVCAHVHVYELYGCNCNMYNVVYSLSTLYLYYYTTTLVIEAHTVHVGCTLQELPMPYPQANQLHVHVALRTAGIFKRAPASDRD